MSRLRTFLELRSRHKIGQGNRHRWRNRPVHATIEDLYATSCRINRGINAILRHVLQSQAQRLRFYAFGTFQPVVLPFPQFIFKQLIKCIDRRIRRCQCLMSNKGEIFCRPLTFFGTVIRKRRQQDPALPLWPESSILQQDKSTQSPTYDSRCRGKVRFSIQMI